jgi:hypothetical protein
MTVRSVGSNRTEIEFPNGTQVLVSYQTPVAAFVPGEGYLKTDKRFGPTTSKHINQWTEKRGKEIPHEQILAIMAGEKKSKPKHKIREDKPRVIKL